MDLMQKSRFTRPSPHDQKTSRNLYVANCGPKVGICLDTIATVFSCFGEVTRVQEVDESGVRVIVSFMLDSAAQAALVALDGKPCHRLGGRILHVRYSVEAPQKAGVDDPSPVSLMASDLTIPGLHLLHDFVNKDEEQELLAAVDSRPWIRLAKRRVQHYGYEFLYETRNVDVERSLGGLPSFVSKIVERVSSLAGLSLGKHVTVDQLTVNEYSPGVGLAPHIDTHSAFEEPIFSLSLAGPCIMEFRKYDKDFRNSSPEANCGSNDTGDKKDSSFTRKAVFLPPRSILLMSSEARYAWHHYIPHHKVDLVGEERIKRGRRRVSFTFRQVRVDPCRCDFKEYCDSQRS